VKRLVLALCCGLSLGVTCGPGGGAPPPDSCNSPDGKSIASLEIGPEISEMRGFEPWLTDDTGYITQGFQGGYMLGVSMRLSGEAPACLQQKTVVKSGSKVIAQETSPLNTYAAADGTRTTKTMFLVFDDSGPPLGSQVQVVATAGGKTTSAYVTIDEDRHKLELLKLITPYPTAGAQVEFELQSRHAPQFEGFSPTLSVSTPGVLQVPASMYVYEDTYRFSTSALAAGETDLIATFRTQEVRVHVVVTQ
jgi:hypothetical protein